MYPLKSVSLQVSLIDSICMGLSRDFRINQASALASLEAEAEIDIEVNMELSSLSEAEKQQTHESEDSVGTNSEDDGEDSNDGTGDSVVSRKRPTFSFKHHSKKWIHWLPLSSHRVLSSFILQYILHCALSDSLSGYMGLHMHK